MSEVDRVFSRHPRRDAPLTETQHIVTAPRKNRAGTIATRVVEVVRVSHGRSKPRADQPHRAPWNAHAETWPDGFRAQSSPPAPPPDAQPPALAPAAPIVHVMPMWEPATQQPVALDEQAAELPSSTLIAARRKPRDPKSNPNKMTLQRFADPFAEDDDGANCLRCGTSLSGHVKRAA